jgi:mannose-6-phosphate isomerase-like protein (cupin superfamily)
MQAALSQGASGLSLETHPIHLGMGAIAEPQPAFPPDERAMAWYMDYARRTQADGTEGRLVSLFHFTESWKSWEMHPHGAEVVVCTAGRMVLLQELADGRHERVVLEPGQYAINPPGVWHTADVDGAATGLFITPGIGTQNRPR